MKQITSNNKSSYDDFDLCINERICPIPSKKTIRENIPYKNGSYDFSMINGEYNYDDREVTYCFDIIDADPIIVENKVSSICSWLNSVFNENIYDDYMPDYHFKGSFDSIEKEDNFDSVYFKVKFICYPYKIKNEKTIIDETITSLKTIIINSNSSHKVIPKIIVNGTINIEFNENNYSLNTGEYNDYDFSIHPGKNELKISSINESTVRFEFYEEVL